MSWLNLEIQANNQKTAGSIALKEVSDLSSDIEEWSYDQLYRKSKQFSTNLNSIFLIADSQLNVALLIIPRSALFIFSLLGCVLAENVAPCPLPPEISCYQFVKRLKCIIDCCFVIVTSETNESAVSIWAEKFTSETGSPAPPVISAERLLGLRVAHLYSYRPFAAAAKRSQNQGFYGRQSFSANVHIDGNAKCIEVGQLGLIANFEPGLDNAALVVMTSGSTGNSKAVILRTSSIIARCEWARKVLNLNSNSVYCQRSSIGFVDIFSEIFPVLTAGGTVAVCTAPSVDSLQLWRSINTARCTHVTLIPTLMDLAFRSIDEYEPIWAKLGRHLQVVVSSGQALRWGIAQQFNAVLPCCRLINLYGATETTGDCLWYEVQFDSKTMAVDADKLIPIGYPLPNTSIVSFESSKARTLRNKAAALLETPFGSDTDSVDAGSELLILGSAVAHGYYNSLNDTLSHGGGLFIIVSVCNSQGEYWQSPAWLSGDMGHMDSEGLWHYVGRSGRSFKINGLLVQPQLIEDFLMLRRYSCSVDNDSASETISESMIISEIFCCQSNILNSNFSIFDVQIPHRNEEVVVFVAFSRPPDCLPECAIRELHKQIRSDVTESYMHTQQNTWGSNYVSSPFPIKTILLESLPRDHVTAKVSIAACGRTYREDIHQQDKEVDAVMPQDILHQALNLCKKISGVMALQLDDDLIRDWTLDSITLARIVVAWNDMCKTPFNLHHLLSLCSKDNMDGLTVRRIATKLNHFSEPLGTMAELATAGPPPGLLSNYVVITLCDSFSEFFLMLPETNLYEPHLSSTLNLYDRNVKLPQDGSGASAESHSLCLKWALYCDKCVDTLPVVVPIRRILFMAKQLSAATYKSVYAEVESVMRSVAFHPDQTLTANESLVVSGSHSCRLYCIAASTGKIIWVRYIAERLMGKPCCYMIIGSDFNHEFFSLRVLVATYFGNIFCFDVFHGILHWTATTNGVFVKAPPVIVGMVAWVPSYDGIIRGYDVSTGSLVRTASLSFFNQTGTDDSIASTGITDEIVSDAESIYAAFLNGIVGSFDLSCQSRLRGRWKFDVGSPIFGHPVLSQNKSTLLVAACSGDVVCLKTDCGSLLWRRNFFYLSGSISLPTVPIYAPLVGPFNLHLCSYCMPPGQFSSSSSSGIEVVGLFYEDGVCCIIEVFTGVVISRVRMQQKITAPVITLINFSRALHSDLLSFGAVCDRCSPARSRSGSAYIRRAFLVTLESGVYVLDLFDGILAYLIRLEAHSYSGIAFHGELISIPAGEGKFEKHCGDECAPAAISGVKNCILLRLLVFGCRDNYLYAVSVKPRDSLPPT